jgi:predicted MFS family arabinose efflux permease
MANSSRADPAPALFLCLFAAQARVFAMRIRTAATQFGYLLGSALGGLALSLGGYPALGAVFAVMFLLAAAPHLAALLPWTARRSA